MPSHVISFIMDNEYYYLDASRQPQGPLAFEALMEKVKTGELSAQVQVAQKGGAQWLSFAILASQQGVPGFEVLPPPPGDACGALPPKPDNNLVWAILCTLLCCLPLGIVAIIKASAVDNLYAQGNYDEACRASTAARNWSLWGAVLGLTVMGLYILLILVLGMAQV